MKEKILIADDNELNITILKNILEKNGYSIIEATNGEEALELLNKETPDLVLLDIMMPIMSGFEAAEIIKKDKKLKHIPILFISALDDNENIIKGFELGGQDYVSKPFNKDELLARIVTHLKIKHLTENLQKKVEENQRLLHVLSHDLANPLQAILSNSEMMKFLYESEGNQNSKYVNNILMMASNMQQLIGYIREMLAIESGKKNFNLKKVSLKEVLDKTEAIFSTRLESKRVKLVYNIDNEKGDFFLSVEPISFQNSVVGNIISNSIKFSFPDSEIIVNAKEKDRFVVIDFIDSGVGIKEANLENIFSSTKSTTTLGTLGEKGTGFGMPLIKKYVEKYGGDIVINSNHIDDSPVTHGSTITVKIPV